MPEGRTQTIVAVDDEEEVRALVSRILTEAGYHVASTTDPYATVELVRAEKPDLLITDITMPGMVMSVMSRSGFSVRTSSTVRVGSVVETTR